MLEELVQKLDSVIVELQEVSGLRREILANAVLLQTQIEGLDERITQFGEDLTVAIQSAAWPRPIDGVSGPDSIAPKG